MLRRRPLRAAETPWSGMALPTSARSWLSVALRPLYGAPLNAGWTAVDAAAVQAADAPTHRAGRGMSHPAAARARR
jgi:hypothetical protein